MQKAYFEAALAGLVHDVGKLLQRAQENPTLPPTDALEGQPVHAAWTQRFLDQMPKHYRSIAMPGAFHHRPGNSPASDNTLSVIVALGDKLSAGERADLTQAQQQPPKQMRSIFDHVHLDKAGEPSGTHFLPLTSLRLSKEAMFPTSVTVNDNQSKGDYSTLVSELETAAKTDIEDPETYLENLLWAMQTTTWCVPSAYYHSIPDISLFDHSRMTAAIAVCLSDWQGDVSALLGAVERDFAKKPQDGDEAKLAEPVALLIGGDISGIQDFIYTISSKYAAKTLRGRSFYLQLLTEAVLRFLLREMGLPYLNVIYASGGHFFFLAPLSQAEKLLALRKQVSEKLISAHGTHLYLALEAIEISPKGFQRGNFPAVWSSLHDQLGERKQQRYQELGSNFFLKVLEPSTSGGNPDEKCSVCGEDRYPIMGGSDDEDKRCSLCSSFATELGAQLADASQIALGFGLPQAGKCQTALEVLRSFGMDVQLITKHSKYQSPEWVERVTLWQLDDDQACPQEMLGKAAIVKHYSVHHIPQYSFDELQKMVKGGFHRLGVLRADVDHLGLVFSQGLQIEGKPAGTLARTSMLSFQISLFFEGWVKRICDDPRWKETIYSVYAGGDDLFLIGPWDIMPDLALQLVSDFSEFTGNHPGLHLSAGLAFIDGKYPVYQAAADAGDAENQAKGAGRNRFFFLGKAWTWDEFNQLAQKKDRLVSLVLNEKGETEVGPRALLGVLRNMAEQRSDAQAHHKGREWGPWIWRGAYMLKRMEERYQTSQPHFTEEVAQIREELMNASFSMMEQWGKAARWAQLFTRNANGKDGTV